MTVFSSRMLAMDCHLIYYPNGSYIPPHNDLVPGRSHYRANLILREADAGGKFFCEEPIWLSKRLNIFRSDFSHEVSRVTGWRLVLSLGWAKA